MLLHARTRNLGWMDSVMADALSQYVYEHDQYEFSFGDVLDVKTGLILAALTFLAIQSGDLIKPGLPLGQHIAQVISVAAFSLWRDIFSIGTVATWLQ